MRGTSLITVVLATSVPLATVDAQAGASPKPPADSGLFHRDQLTGDWGGLRTQWKNKGFDVASSVTQFEQGVASGGIKTGSEYNGKADLALAFDLEKLKGWKNWSVDAKAEVRFGGPAWLQLTGDLQVIRPNRPTAGTTTIPGARLRVVF